MVLIEIKLRGFSCHSGSFYAVFTFNCERYDPEKGKKTKIINERNDFFNPLSKTEVHPLHRRTIVPFSSAHCRKRTRLLIKHTDEQQAGSPSYFLLISPFLIKPQALSLSPYATGNMKDENWRTKHDRFAVERSTRRIVSEILYVFYLVSLVLFIDHTVCPYMCVHQVKVR